MRNFTSLIALLAFSILLAGCAAYKCCEDKCPLKKESFSVVVGTYATNGSEGIYQLDVNKKTGAFSQPKLLTVAKDATYLAVSKKGIVYGALRENNGTLVAYSPNQNNGLSQLNSQLTQGANPCYLAFDAKQEFIASANYNSGSTSVFALDKNGALLPNPTVLQHTLVEKNRTGINLQRQEAPHAHWAQWSPHDTDLLYVVDLGLDEIKIFPRDARTKKIGEGKTAFKTKAGAGPRQLAFHPQKRLAYVLNELNNTLVVTQIKTDGTLEEIQSLSTLPENTTLQNTAGHIVINKAGTRIYTSNRGHNSIARFAVADDGRVTFLGTTSTQGDWPRMFSLFEEENLLLVANQKSNDIFSYFVAANGDLTPTGQKVNVGAPAYVDRY